MKPFVRYTALILGTTFVSGAAFAWFDVLTHENILTNPELKTAAGWLTTGLMLLGLALRGWRRSRRSGPAVDKPENQPPKTIAAPPP